MEQQHWYSVLRTREGWCSWSVDPFSTGRRACGLTLAVWADAYRLGGHWLYPGPDDLVGET